ncbi:putative sphingosine kinase [Wilcoxina mikolae CBS 423.85]|nr:putative sphingosine kinase [Wilcoxina mikolae CBS 423.85]
MVLKKGATGGSASIMLYNVLWVDVETSSITIKFAATKFSKASVKPSCLTYSYELPSLSEVESWAMTLLQLAYEDSQIQKRFKVLINPFGGQGHAKNLFEKQSLPLLSAANCTIDVETTEYRGHAIEIAKNIDIDAYDAVICCSGDGVPSEVFNGLAKRDDAIKALRRIAVCQLPCGSGNAMCWNLAGTGDVSVATLSIIKSIRKPLDLVSITQGEERFLSFLTQSFGIIADVDLGTEELRWMGGYRFTVGLMHRLWKQTVYPCDIAVGVAVDNKETIRDHYRQGVGQDDDDDPSSETGGLPPLQFGTVDSQLPPDWQLIHHPNMGNFYAGNMAYVSAGADFFPASLPNDGLFDLVCINGTISRRSAMAVLLSVETGAHFKLPQVSYRKVVGYRIIPHKRVGVEEEYISIDGERVPFAPFQAEVHSGLGTVLAKGHLYQAPGV